MSSIDIEVPKPEPGDEPDTVIAGTPSVYMTVVKEKEAIELLDKAVALWDTLGHNISDASMLLQSIMTCARVYQLLRKVCKWSYSSHILVYCTHTETPPLYLLQMSILITMQKQTFIQTEPASQLNIYTNRACKPIKPLDC